MINCRVTFTLLFLGLYYIVYMPFADFDVTDGTCIFDVDVRSGNAMCTFQYNGYVSLILVFTGSTSLFVHFPLSCLHEVHEVYVSANCAWRWWLLSRYCSETLNFTFIKKTGIVVIVVIIWRRDFTLLSHRTVNYWSDIIASLEGFALFFQFAMAAVIDRIDRTVKRKVIMEVIWRSVFWCTHVRSCHGSDSKVSFSKRRAIVAVIQKWVPVYWKVEPSWQWFKFPSIEKSAIVVVCQVPKYWKVEPSWQ